MMLRVRTGLSMLLVVVAVGSIGAARENPWTEPARYAFEYRVDLTRLSEMHAQRLRVWIPYPAETADQKVLSVEIDSPWAYRQTRDDRGNRFLYLEGEGAPPAALAMRFVVERKPSGGIPNGEIAPDTPLDPRRYQRGTRLIPLAGVIRDLAEQESRGLTTDEAKIRAFYDYVVRNMRYNKEGTGWGRGDAVWACANKRGNCTDFHSLFIGMALSQGIPARFLIGFPIPMAADAGEVAGYHCWAEYYDRRRGWVPVDASEAKKSGKSDQYFGSLPNDRIQFTVGRDLLLEPRQEGEPLNYFIYPYAEADGKPVKELAATFGFRRLPRTAEHL